MPPATRAFLDGITLLGSSPVQWSLTEGVAPYTTTVDMVPDQAYGLLERLKGSMRPVDLLIDSGGQEKKFRNIFVIGQSPAASPHVVRLQLTDMRYWWRYFHIGPWRFNWRRRSGFKRLKDPATPEMVEDVQADVWYAPWSMYADPIGGSRVWEATDILDIVLRRLSASGRRFHGVEMGFVFDQEPPKQMPIENLLLDGTGDASLARALGACPGFGLFLDADGLGHFYDRTSGNEVRVWSQAGAEKVGQGHVERISNALVRPKAIDVLFSLEVELRFDFEESSTVESVKIGETSVAGVIGGTDVRGMDNVLQNPDFLSQAGKPSGAWMTFTDALTEWNTEAVPGFGRLDYPLIRKAMSPFMDLWSGILQLGRASPDIDWSGRINAITQHYRKTFQVNQRWWSRILSVKAYRVAIIDKETGSRAPAAVWANFCRMGTMRSMFRDIQAGVDLSYLMNVQSYPSESAANGRNPGVNRRDDINNFASIYPVASGTAQADARCTIADPDQGVLHIDFLADENAMYEMCLPSACGVPPFDLSTGMPLDAGPVANAKDRNRPLTFDAISTAMGNSNFSDVPQLAPDHRVAIIISAIPASWNKDVEEQEEGRGGEPGNPSNHGFRQNLYRVRIDSENIQLRQIVSPAVAADLDDASGPPMEVRIGAGVEVARVAWVDSRAGDIEAIFGLGNLGDGEANIDGLIVNAGDGKRGASLNQIALAAAASIYAGMADHLQGAMSTTFQPDLEPAGWLDEVTHELATSGEGRTTLDFPEQLPKFDLLSYMDASTRATIMKLAQPGI